METNLIRSFFLDEEETFELRLQIASSLSFSLKMLLAKSRCSEVFDNSCYLRILAAEFVGDQIH